jgi:neutral trehalase
LKIKNKSSKLKKSRREISLSETSQNLKNQWLKTSSGGHGKKLSQLNKFAFDVDCYFHFINFHEWRRSFYRSASEPPAFSEQ